MALQSVVRRIDNVEFNLTPKEWAIRLADELRKYPSEDEFHYSILNYSSIDETPIHKPFLILNKQAEERHPGHKSEDIRSQERIARKLRGEYQALKTLINRSNEKIGHKAEIWKLKASLQMSAFNNLLFQDAKAVSCMTIDGNPSGEPCQFAFPSMIRAWRPKTYDLILDFFIYDAVLKTIQEKYFDGHLFIYRDVEKSLLKTRIALEDLVSAFNEYLAKMEPKIAGAKDKNGPIDTAAFLKRLTLNIDETIKLFDQESIVAGAEKWAKDARDKVIVEHLDDMGRHDEASRFLWDIAREEIRERQTASKELDSVHIVSD
jgi:hypothetical protein